MIVFVTEVAMSPARLRFLKCPPWVSVRLEDKFICSMSFVPCTKGSEDLSKELICLCWNIFLLSLFLTWENKMWIFMLCPTWSILGSLSQGHKNKGVLSTLNLATGVSMQILGLGGNCSNQVVPHMPDLSEVPMCVYWYIFPTRITQVNNSAFVTAECLRSVDWSWRHCFPVRFTLLMSLAVNISESIALRV